MKKTKWYNRQWVIAIISSAILPLIVTGIWDKIKEKPIFSTFISIIISIRDFFLLNVPIWGVLAFLILMLMVFFVFATKTSSNSSLPPFINYTSDRLKNWIWKWEWELDPYSLKWTITNLKPYCPICDTPLHIESFGYSLSDATCPRCNKYFERRFVENEDVVRTLIVDNANKERYKNNS